MSCFLIPENQSLLAQLCDTNEVFTVEALRSIPSSNNNLNFNLGRAALIEYIPISETQSCRERLHEETSHRKKSGKVLLMIEVIQHI